MFMIFELNENGSLTLYFNKKGAYFLLTIHKIININFLNIDMYTKIEKKIVDIYN